MLFLHGGNAAVAEQSFPIGLAGRFRLSFKSAHRPNNGLQNVLVRIDGNTIGTINPAGTTFAEYVIDDLLLSAGTHSLQFVGTDNLHAHAAFVDDVQLTRVDTNALRWTDPATWNGTPPGINDDVIIPPGVVVLLDGAAQARSVDVQGELHCTDSDISLAAEWVMVTGRLGCGSRAYPFTHTFTITLNGNNDHEDIMMMGDKFVGAMGSGVIELHGEARKSWTRLAATPAMPRTQLTLADAVDWRPGDQIVVAPTQAAADEGEVVTISAVSSTTITVTPALTKVHNSGQSTFTNGTDSWTVDERAEVGLLTRNIRIQGGSGTTNGYGGHMMTMVGSTVHASGIELYQMGQKQALARYPFHWHMVGSAPGQYFVNSSIHKSFNRCVTVHGTHDTLVADNVCYDFLGHGYFLEDGIEQRNVFDHNLAVWARRPAADEQLLDTDNRESPASNGPAAFWISNPNNTFTNNAAAGSEGTGYWYHTEQQVTGPSSVPGAVPYVANYHPNTAPFGIFDNNLARAARQGFSSCVDTGGAAGLDSVGALISRLTVTNVTQGIWPCAADITKMNTVFERAVVANTPNGMQAPSPMTFIDSAFIAYTANPRPEILAEKYGMWRAVPVYDQGFLLERVHFVNYDQPNASIFGISGGVHKSTANRVSDLTFDNSPHLFLDQDLIATSHINMVARGDVIHDLDGSLIGQNMALVSNHPLMSDETCSRAAGAGVFGYACPYRYAQFRLDGGIDASGQPPRITVVRSDGVHDSGFLINWRVLNEFILDGYYRYAYRLDDGINRYALTATMQGGNAGETSIHEILDVPADFAFPANSGWTR